MKFHEMKKTDIIKEIIEENFSELKKDMNLWVEVLFANSSVLKDKCINL